MGQSGGEEKRGEERRGERERGLLEKPIHILLSCLPSSLPPRLPADRPTNGEADECGGCMAWICFVCARDDDLSAVRNVNSQHVYFATQQSARASPE